jgi:mono/diheme cytochrome c family protein
LLTKSLLFLADSSNAVMGRAGVSGPAKFRAYDKATGQLVAQIDLPVGATGGPMTYMLDGKQYILLPVGGRGYGAGWVALGLGGISIYTEAQAQHGGNMYRSKCSGCHGGDLTGEHAPPLKGEPFWSEWSGETARSLYSRIISTMPPDDAGSLAEKDVIDLMAYLLQVNGMPAGTRTVENAGELNNVRLQKPK